MIFKKQDGRRDCIRQLIGMTSVNISVICKLTFAFPPENICVSVKQSVNTCRLSISLHVRIAQYHKRGSAMNVPAPHEYQPVFNEK